MSASATSIRLQRSGGGMSGFFRRLFGAEEHHDRGYYSQHLQGNRCAVIVHATGESVDRAADILNSNGALGVHEESDTVGGESFAGDRTGDELRGDVEHLPVG